MTSVPVAREESPRGARVWDLATVLAAFRRRWPIFAAVALVVALAVIAASLLVTPIYAATARLRVEPTDRSALDVKATMNGAPPDQALVDTELAVIRSRGLAAQVADRLAIAPRGASAAARARAVDAVQSRLAVSREGSTYVINVAYRSPDPQEAARVANAFAEQYIVASVDARVRTASRQAAFLNERLRGLGAEVEAADQQVAQYRSGTGIVTGSGTAGAGTVVDQQIASITGQVATAASDAASARSNLDAARAQISKGGIEAVTGVLNSQVIADLRRQRAEVVRNQGEVNTRYGPRHPESIKVQQQLEQIDQQLRDESRRIVASLESTAAAADARAGSLRAELNGLRGQQAGNARLSVEADSLQRQADAKRNIYNQVAQAAQQSSQERRSTEPTAQIIEEAAPPPAPSFPNKPLFAVLGALLGVLAAATVVLLLELFDRAIRSADDVEQGLGLPLLSALPLLRGSQLAGGNRRTGPWTYVVDKPMSAYAEAVRTVRSALLLSAATPPPRVICLTSALPGDGKTTCAVSLARIMALSGERVVLVDCDLRRGALRSLVKADERGGLVELLQGEVTLENAIVRDSVAGLDVLTLRREAFTPRDVLGGEAMRGLVARLREQYDHVVLDAPPALAVSDARTLAALSDAVVLVARWGRTARNDLRVAAERLTGDGARIAGVVLNQVDPRAPDALGVGGDAYNYGAYARYYQG